MITTVLLDLDGVVRHFDPSHVALVERRHGLAPGALMGAAFHPDLLEPAITGQVSRAHWAEQVGKKVNNPEAATQWMAGRGTVDQEMLRFVDALRLAGTTVAILTNGTSTIPEEMEFLGLVPHFDAIFSSAEIGYAKPDERAFRAVCKSLAVAPSEVFFTDDTPSKLAGAISLGMHATPFTNVEELRRQLIDLGVGAPKSR